METTKIIYKLICLLILLITTSCAVSITTKFTQNSVEIEKGDTAKLFWVFYDAEYVKVSGFEDRFALIDSLFVTPNSTTEYKVHAFDQFKKQTLSIDWLVTVVDSKAPLFDTNKLDDFVKYGTPAPDISANQRINSIIIVGSNIQNTPDEDEKHKNTNNNEYSVKFVPFDASGNPVKGIFVDEKNLHITAPNSKVAKPHITKIDVVVNEHPVNFCICLDNSAAGTRSNQNILNTIHSHSSKFPLTDNFYFSFFNQNFGGVELIGRTKTGTFNEVFRRIPAPSGFSAMNKSVGQTINYMLAKATGKNVIIIIANSADNASVLYDENDLIEHAQKNEIPIYVIAIGTSIPTYNLSNLTNSTGGKIYYLPENEINLLPHYFDEIILSQKQYYNVRFSAHPADNDAFLDVELALNGTHNEVFKDSYSFPLKTQKVFSEYQVLASYSLGDTLLESSFLPAISNLAEVLISNPNLVVELIGNSGSIEGNDEICHRIGLRRAQMVRRQLIENGAHPEQIRVSSEGAARPLFQTPRFDWQFRHNNRVEIRWLLPEEMPFEIIADYKFTENEAQLNVEDWEHKGYKAYYQRIMRNNRPAYRTLIWGYSEELAAENEAKKLSRQYKRQFVLR